MKFLVTLMTLLFIGNSGFAQQEVSACEENCEISWEQVITFPAVARSYDVNVYERASEVYVKSVNGVGTIRELILYLRNGQQRYLTDTYDKIMSPGGTGVLVSLGRDAKDVQFIRIKADSWGGAGTEVGILVQLRERY